MATDHITLGSGDLYLNGVHVGYLSGEVTAIVENAVKKFQSGVPKRTIVQVIEGTSMSLKAGLAEISASNMAMAMGQQASVAWTAGAATVVDGDNEEHTFRADPTNDLEFIQLGPGPGIATTFSSVVVKDLTEVTTYTVTTDYLVNATTGKVTRVDGGTITTLETVRVSYAYVKVAGDQVNVGFEQEINDCLLQFIHTNPRTLKETSVVIWKAQTDGQFNLPFGDDFVKTDVTWEALEDTARTANSLGYIFIQS